MFQLLASQDHIVQIVGRMFSNQDLASLQHLQEHHNPKLGNTLFHSNKIVLYGLSKMQWSITPSFPDKQRIYWLINKEISHQETPSSHCIKVRLHLANHQ
jgi:hypothetical protein